MLEPVPDELLESFLERDERVCPNCRYTLHRLRSGRCPECGAAIALTLHASTPMRAPWIASVVVASVSAGTGVIGWAIGPDDLLWLADQSIALAILIVWFVLVAPLVTFGLLVWHRPLRRLPRAIGWIGTGVVAVAAAFSYTALLLWTR